MIRKKGFQFHKRLLALVLIVAFFVGVVSPALSGSHVEAVDLPKTISLIQAKKLAIKNSKALEKLDLQLDAKYAALSSALKSIPIKEHDMSTFRWSPLINLKFPQSPDLSTAYEFQYKPVRIQYEIDKLKHKYNDTKLTEYENVINLYVDIVVCEKRIEFNEKRAKDMRSTLNKSKVKLLSGDATQNDIDSMQKALDNIELRLAADGRALITAKKKISNVLNLDVTTRYRFQDPFLETEISRFLLPELTQYTLDRDDTYYDLCIEETAQKLSVQTNYSFLKSHYPSQYMELISPYIESALKGEDINVKAFYKNYKKFVNTVNEKWEGHTWILFFKLKKEWFQGEVDGDRYIENDPYVEYTAVLDYKDAMEARAQGETDLRDAVTDAFDNYITIRSSYESYKDQVEKAEEDLEKARILHEAGELLYVEYKEQLENYDELQNSLLDSMKQYTQTIISFDRLTCGGVSAYLGDLLGDFSDITGGEEYVDAEYITGAYYYIEPIIQSEQFKLRIYIPDDYELDVTHYELWIDNVQVGERTPVDKTIRHLATDLESVSKAFIRFYHRDSYREYLYVEAFNSNVLVNRYNYTFIDDVEIDPLQYSGPLDIIKSYNVREVEEIGEYILAYSQLRDQYTLTLKMNPGENIAFYRIKDTNGAYLIDESLRKIDKPMNYLNTINASMGLLVFEFYDASGSKLYEGEANTTLMKLYKKVGE